jgi:hypothetical protein
LGRPRRCSPQRGLKVKIEEAFAIAAQAKPKHRQPLSKRQASIIAKRLSVGAAELNKRYDVMGGSLAKAQGQLNQIAADVEYLKNFTPGSPPRRLQ